MPGRSVNAGDYRYGFNGKESDGEIYNNTGTSYDYGFRIFNPRLGRFLSVDPLTSNFAWWSPYHFAGNTPIQALDLDGLEILDYRSQFTSRVIYETNIVNPDGRYVAQIVKRNTPYSGTFGQLLTTEQEQKFQQTMAEHAAYWSGNTAINFNPETSTVSENRETPNTPGAYGEVVKGNKFDKPSGQKRGPGGGVGGGLLLLSEGLYNASKPLTVKQQDIQQELEAFNLASTAANLYNDLISDVSVVKGYDDGDGGSDYFRSSVINYIVDGTLPYTQGSSGYDGSSADFNNAVQTVGNYIISRHSELNTKKSKNDTSGGRLWERYKNAVGGN